MIPLKTGPLSVKPLPREGGLFLCVQLGREKPKKKKRMRQSEKRVGVILRRVVYLITAGNSSLTYTTMTHTWDIFISAGGVSTQKNPSIFWYAISRHVCNRGGKGKADLRGNLSRRFLSNPPSDDISCCTSVFFSFFPFYFPSCREMTVEGWWRGRMKREK